MEKELLYKLALAYFPMKNPKPTLSELISSCGDEFGSLWLTPEDQLGKVSWGCSPEWNSRKKVETENYQVFGDSPEEAVANLYLKLHELRKDN